MKPQRKLVLASNSKYKRAQMERLGLSFESRIPRCAEEGTDGEPPRSRVVRFAREKAESLLSDYDEALVVGADQGVEFQGDLFGKPQTRENAQRQLASLAGREHLLLTAVAVVDAKSGQIFEDLDVCKMLLRELSPQEIAAYVEEDLPLDCAGAYKFESKGVRLFSRVRAQDPTAIVGLPLVMLGRLLERAGYPLFDGEGNPKGNGKGKG